MSTHVIEDKPCMFVVLKNGQRFKCSAGAPKTYPWCMFKEPSEKCVYFRNKFVEVDLKTFKMKMVVNLSDN